jgi:antitoxin PrlF
MTKITTKGQVTIPKRLRDHLGLEPGSSVEFELAADGRVFFADPATSAEQVCSPARKR